MNPDTFRTELERDGYVEIESKTFPADRFVDWHTHPFDVRALVLDGDAEIACDGVPRHYRAGDVVEVGAGVEHTEQYGPNGYTLLLGRRYPTGDA